jgi:hypothetical protein
MKVLPLPSPKIMLSLRYNRYYEQLRLPADPVKLHTLISTGCPINGHRPGPLVFVIVWLLLPVTPVTPEVHLSVLAVRVKIDAAVFPFVGEGRQLHLHFRGCI